MFKLIKISTVIIGSFYPSLILAAINLDQKAPEITSISEIYKMINRIIDTGFVILLTVSGFLILYAAYLYLLAGTDEKNIETAKKTITYAAVGIAVSFLAKGFSTIILGILD